MYHARRAKRPRHPAHTPAHAGAADRDTHTLRQLYRNIPSPALILLRQAFELDAVEAKLASVALFCATRIDLIEQVLRVRQGLKRRQARRQGLQAAIDEVAAALAPPVALEEEPE